MALGACTDSAVGSSAAGSSAASSGGESAAVATAVESETLAETSTSEEAGPLTAGTATSLPQPFVEQVWWEETTFGATLKIRPTAAGRQTGGGADGQLAWAEVLDRDPGADTPGMYAQFICHWDFARIVEPDKASWNIEPWRPVVDDLQMVTDRCNPGGPEV